jgi:predicted RNA-binding protein YlxR (DUF448 family)
MKKIPVRLCLATNQAFPKKDMFRVVRTPEGEVCVDYSGKKNGRGAYISKSKEAIMLAKSKKVLERKLEVAIPDEIYEELLKNI